MNFWKLNIVAVLLTIPTACQVGQFPLVGTSTMQNVAQAYATGSIPREAEMWQTDPFLKNYAQAQLRGRIPMGEDGAFGTNREHPEQVQVGWQRAGVEAVAFGIATGDKSVVRRGLLVFRWAFERQSSDGSFGISQYPEVVSFLGAYARALLVLRDAGLTSEAKELSRYLPQIQKTLSRPDFFAMEKRWEEHERRYPLTNQRFWAAFCYHMIHLVQPNPRLETQARTWLQQGLSRQLSDGSFPEKGGSDTNYQGASLRFLSLYSFYSPNDRHLIKPHLSKGFAWLVGKVLPNGTIDISRNTRTGRNQEIAPTGKFKNGRFGDPLPYIYWSYLGGGLEARQIATRVYEARRSRTQARE